MSRNVENGAISPPQNDLSKKPSFLTNKFLAGAGLGGGDFLLGQGIQLAAATEGATVGFMRPMIENHSSVVILASAIVVGTAVTMFGARQNLRLLKEDKIGISPNGVGTFVFHLIDRKWPSKETVRDVLTQAVQVLTTKDYFLIAPALVNKRALAAFVTAKAAASAFNLVKAGISEVVLRKARNKEKKETEKEKVRVSNAGIIKI